MAGSVARVLATKQNGDPTYVQFENTFSVDAPIDRVWTYLLDVEQVAPCLPGAELMEAVSDREYKGSVKVKLGAMQINYKGTLVLNEVDDAGHRIVMTATGSETRGTGGASGTVTSTLNAESPTKTTVLIISEVNITGRVAQFGRNIIQDVSNKLIREFARCLETRLAADPTAESSSGGQRVSSEPTSGAVTSAPNEPKQAATASALDPVAGHAPVTTESASRPEAPTRLPPGQRPEGATELKVMPLLLDVTRSRLATGLRKVAKLVDPDK